MVRMSRILNTYVPSVRQVMLFWLSNVVTRMSGIINTDLLTIWAYMFFWKTKVV